MQQFETLNRQQQPFIQSGYGAMSKLNTLLGIGARPMSRSAAANPVTGVPAFNAAPNQGQTYRPTPNGGMQQIVAGGPSGGSPISPRGGGGTRLSHILRLRAANGDTEAQRILGLI